LQLSKVHGFRITVMENPASDPRESLWRRKLSAAERAELRGQPELEEEARLTEALGRLPDAPVSSNFTARVMTAIDLEDARSSRAQPRFQIWHLDWRRLWPRLAIAAAVLVFSALGVQRYEAGVHRAEIARSLSVIASAQSVPSVDVLNNFDVIQRMGQSGRADTDLLAALQ
jgi:hypothetical protein